MAGRQKAKVLFANAHGHIYNARYYVGASKPLSDGLESTSVGSGELAEATKAIFIGADFRGDVRELFDKVGVDIYNHHCRRPEFQHLGVTGLSFSIYDTIDIHWVAIDTKIQAIPTGLTGLVEMYQLARIVETYPTRLKKGQKQVRREFFGAHNAGNYATFTFSTSF